LVLGAGGTGKSSLARVLTSVAGPFGVAGSNYEESISIERYPQSIGRTVEVVVPPGQQHRRESTWPELLAEVSAGKFSGVVHVVCHGYHSIGKLSYKDHRLYEGNKEPFDALRKWESP